MLPCAAVLSSMALDATLLHQSLRHALVDMHASARALCDRIRDAQPAVAQYADPPHPPHTWQLKARVAGTTDELAALVLLYNKTADVSKRPSMR